MKKVRLATVWLDGCSGCHMSLLDMDEAVMNVAKRVDVIYGPLVDAQEFPKMVDVTLVEGAVSSQDDLEKVRTIRQRSKVLVAFGDCAVTGNVTALRNLFKVEDVLNRAYKENSAVISGLPLGGDGIIPKLLDRVLRIQDVVPVDHFLPGCPPSADAIFAFVVELLGGRSPVVEGRKFGT
jgi:NAD-reducing hydrogenase small subunit